MAARFLIDVVFIPEPAIVANAYFALAEQVDDMREPVEEIVQFISENGIPEVFEAGRSGGWPAHADSTVERWGEHKLLHLDGDLEGAATSPEAWSIQGSGQTVTASLAPNLPPYGIFHIEGTDFMPSRNFVELPAHVVDKAEDIFEQWVDKQLATF